MSKKCEICNHSLKSAVKFSSSPYGDNFFKSINEAKSAKFYPLNVLQCSKCMILTLEERLSSEEKDESLKPWRKSTLYTSNITKGLVETYRHLVSILLKKHKINSVLDIGSNDGSFLKIFSNNGISTVGVEPSEYAASKAEEKGIKTINSFFNNEVVRTLKENQTFDLISVNYIFANVRDINEFLVNVNTLLNEDGKLLITTGYHPEQLKKGMLDYIYHEHFHYFSVKSMNELLIKHDFIIDDIIELQDRGSSLSFISSKKCKGKESQINPKITKYISSEIDGKFNDPSTINNYKKYYDNELLRIKTLLESHKKNGKKIIGFGASLSTSIFLYENKIGALIDQLIDDNEIKHDSYSPGWGIKVTSPSDVKNDTDTIILILAWQHSNIIYKKYKNIFSNSTWIIPFYDRIIKQ